MPRTDWPRRRRQPKTPEGFHLAPLRGWTGPLLQDIDMYAVSFAPEMTCYSFSNRYDAAGN